MYKIKVFILSFSYKNSTDSFPSLKRRSMIERFGKKPCF